MLHEERLLDESIDKMQRSTAAESQEDANCMLGAMGLPDRIALPSRVYSEVVRTGEAGTGEARQGRELSRYMSTTPAGIRRNCSRSRSRDKDNGAGPGGSAKKGGKKIKKTNKKQTRKKKKTLRKR